MLQMIQSGWACAAAALSGFNVCQESRHSYLGDRQTLAHSNSKWMRLGGQRPGVVFQLLWSSLATVPYVHHVSILHDVVLAFEAEGAFGAGVCLGTRFQQLIPANGLGPDEVLFQIGVNRAGAVLGTRIQRDRPGAAFILSGGEERDQSQQATALADQT